jgi:MoxR-like ATPase
MSNFTTPEDVFGPLDIPGLENGRYRRLTDGYLPWSDVAFLDEFWRGPDSMLNAFLSIFNERTYRNDGQFSSVPLSSAFIASNDLPANESLNAIADRIPLWLYVTPIIEPANFQRMLNLELSSEIEPVISWAEVEAVKAEVQTLPISPAVVDILTEIWRDLKKANIEPSDRRFRQALNILRAEAWLDGSDSVEAEHVAILTNAFWSQVEQIPDVERIVLDKANPLEKATRELLAEIDKIGDIIQRALAATDADERQNLGMEAHPKVKKASAELEKLVKEAGNSRRQQALTTRCKEKLHTHSKTLIVDIFELDQATPQP